MPDFEFTSPDGKKYTVTGPDGGTPEQAFNILQSQIGDGGTAVPGSAVQTQDDMWRATKSLKRGVANLAGTGYGLTALGADAVGATGVGDWALENYKRTQNEAQGLASDVPTYKDVNSLSDAGAYAVDTVFENLPMFLPSLVSGGIGATAARMSAEKLVASKVAQLTAAGMAETAAKELVAKEVARKVAVTGIGSAAVPNVGMEAGGIYGDIVDQTGKRGGSASAIALGGGALAGAIDTVSEAVPLLKAFGPVGEKVTGSLIKRLGVEGAKQFLVEGGTEGLQTIIEQASVSAAGGDKGINWDDVIDSTLKGGIGGGIIGAGAQGVSEFRGRGDPADLGSDLSTGPGRKVTDYSGAPKAGAVYDIDGTNYIVDSVRVDDDGNPFVDISEAGGTSNSVTVGLNDWASFNPKINVDESVKAPPATPDNVAAENVAPSADIPLPDSEPSSPPEKRSPTSSDDIAAWEQIANVDVDRAKPISLERAQEIHTGLKRNAAVLSRQSTRLEYQLQDAKDAGNAAAVDRLTGQLEEAQKNEKRNNAHIESAFNRINAIKNQGELKVSDTTEYTNALNQLNALQKQYAAWQKIPDSSPNKKGPEYGSYMKDQIAIAEKNVEKLSTPAAKQQNLTGIPVAKRETNVGGPLAVASKQPGFTPGEPEPLPAPTPTVGGNLSAGMRGRTSVADTGETITRPNPSGANIQRTGTPLESGMEGRQSVADTGGVIPGSEPARVTFARKALQQKRDQQVEIDREELRKQEEAELAPLEKPKSLYSFIASKGGINIEGVNAGEVVGIPKYLISKKGQGLTPNEMARAAAAEGYELSNAVRSQSNFQIEGEANERAAGTGGTEAPIDGLVAALEKSAGKETYRPQDTVALQKIKERQARIAEFGSGEVGVRRSMLAARGIKTEPTITARESRRLLDRWVDSQSKVTDEDIARHLEQADQNFNNMDADDDFNFAEVGEGVPEPSNAAQAVQQNEQVGKDTGTETEVPGKSNDGTAVRENGRNEVSEDERRKAIEAARAADEAEGIDDSEPTDAELESLEEQDRGEWEPDYKKRDTEGDDADEVDAVAGRLVTALRRFDPKGRIAFKLADKIEAYFNGELTEVDGQYFKKLIQVSRTAKDKVGTLNHEVIHALRDLGLFTKEEWDALTSAAAADPEIVAKVEKLYDTEKMTPSQIAEEQVAFLHSKWQEQAGTFKGRIANLLDRITRVIKAAGSFIRGRGFTKPVTTEGILGKVNRGEVGSRSTTGKRGFQEPKYASTEKINTVDGKRDQYVIPGTEQTAKQAAAARGEKMKPKVAQKEAGGLFAQGNDKKTQGALFQMREQIDDAYKATELKDKDGKPIEGKDAEKIAAKVNASTPKEPDSVDGLTPRDLSIAMKYLVSAQTVARNNTPFAKYFQLQKDKRAEIHNNIETDEKKVIGLIELTDAQLKKFKAAMEYYRLAGIKPAKGSTLSFVTPDNYKGELIKPGRQVNLDAYTTKMVRAVHSLANDIWARYSAARAKNIVDYKGEWNKKDVQAFADEARTKPGFKWMGDAIEGIWKAYEQGERESYVPFSRQGDAYVAVYNDGSDGLGKRVIWNEGVDTTLGLTDIRNKAGKKDALIQKKVNELRARFPASEGYTIKAGYNVDRNPDDIGLSDFDKVMELAMKDEKSFRAGMDEVKIKDKKLRDELKSASEQMRQNVIKQLISSHRRQSNNIPGYSTDFVKSISDYIRSSAVSVASLKYNDAIDAAYSKAANQPGAPNYSEFTKNYHEYLDKPERLWSGLKQFGFFTSIWGSASSALVNGVQTPMITMPQLAAWGGGRSMGIMLKNLGFVMRALGSFDTFTKTGATLPFERVAKLIKDPIMRSEFMKATRSGLINATVADDLMGENDSQGASRGARQAAQRFFKIGASLFNTMEQINRAVAWLSAYETLKDGGARKAFMEMHGSDGNIKALGPNPTSAELANFFVNDTQFIGGNLDRPVVMRGVGGVILQFKQYPMNYMRLLLKGFNGQGARGKAAAAMMLGAMLLAAGAKGLPFAEDILNLLDTLGSAGGVDPMIGYNLEKMLRSQDVPEGVRTFMASGLGKMTGLDLSRRFGMGEVSPGLDMVRSVPLINATVGRFMEGAERLPEGQKLGAVAAVSPFLGKGISDVVKGYAVAKEGLNTRGGTATIPSVEVTKGQAIAKALGFQPTEFSKQQEHDRDLTRLKYKTSKAENALRDKLVDALKESFAYRKAGDAAKANEYMKRAQEIVRKANENYKNEPVLENRIKPPNFKSAAKRAQAVLNERLSLQSARKEKRQAIMEAISDFEADNKN